MTTRKPEIRGHHWTREDFLNGVLDEHWRPHAAAGHTKMLTVAEREEIKHGILAALPDGADVWVFGYGSLVWNPAFHFVESRIAHLHGWHRSFCFWSRMGRGSPERPGLMMGLMPGGACRGIAYRIARAAAEIELRALLMREMLGTAYRMRWVDVTGAEGPVRAITFTANKEHTTFCGRMPLEEAARYIATARGKFGCSRDYLDNTVRHLEALGIRDRNLRKLHALVEKIVAAQGEPSE